MDDADLRIVRELQRDARISNKTLAARVGLAPSTTLARVRALEQRQVITGYRACVDPQKLGNPIEALVFVRLRPKNDDVVRRFVEAAWAIEATVGLYLVTGGDDAIVHVTVPSTDSLRATVLNRISTIEGVVDERTSLIFEHRAR